jgi:hypothetical protein
VRARASALFEIAHDSCPNRLPRRGPDTSSGQLTGPVVEFACPSGGDLFIRLFQTDEQLFGYPRPIVTRQPQNLGE